MARTKLLNPCEREWKMTRALTRHGHGTISGQDLPLRRPAFVDEELSAKHERAGLCTRSQTAAMHLIILRAAMHRQAITL